MASNLMARGDARGPLNFFARGMSMATMDDSCWLARLRDSWPERNERKGRRGEGRRMWERKLEPLYTLLFENRLCCFHALCNRKIRSLEYKTC